MYVHTGGIYLLRRNGLESRTHEVSNMSSASRSAMDGVIDLAIDENSLSSVRSEDGCAHVSVLASR